MTQDTVAKQPHVSTRAVVEHRWGTRLELDLPVTLRTEGSAVMGFIRNASISGALIETRARLAPLSPITVMIRIATRGREYHLDLAACVARCDRDAIAVEWRDMACEGLVDLLQALRADAQLWARDSAFG
jgi:hypothetical protein